MGTENLMDLAKFEGLSDSGDSRFFLVEDNCGFNFPPRGIQSFGFWKTWGTRTHALGYSEVNSSWWKAALTQYLSRSKLWMGIENLMDLAKIEGLSDSANSRFWDREYLVGLYLHSVLGLDIYF